MHARDTTVPRTMRTAGGNVRPVRCDTTARAPMTTRAATPARGRYILRVAPDSVAIGTMLDVGASVKKNHTAGNPHAGERHHNQIANATSVGTIAITTP